MKLKIRSQKWTYWIGRLILGAIFIYAAILKFGSPQDFADGIAAYQLLPYSLINLLAMGLPLFELVCGLLVLTGFFLRVGILGILTMLVLFTAALAITLLRGLSVNCGCFGAHSWLDSNPWIALLRDGIFLGLAVFVYKYRLRFGKIQGKRITVLQSDA
jgi:uncharacterized membrane protein YphA (DoxX/SURF4 family)